MNVLKFYAKSLSAFAFFVGTPLVAKEWYINKFEPEEKDLSDKTVVISGATSGIGLRTAYEFANLNAKVIMLCKDEKQCVKIRRNILNKTKNGKIFCSKVDLDSLKSVKECAGRLNKSLDKIDILINCAAVMMLPRKTITEDGLEEHMAVNHYSHFVLTNLLLDKLKASSNVAKILNITCQEYKKGSLDFDDLNLLKNYTPADAYRQSKLANVLFTKELNNVLKDTNINVFSVRANKCHTRIHRHFSYYDSYLLSIFPRIYFWFFEFTLPQVVETIKYAALDKSLDDKLKSGICINNCKEEKCKLSENYLKDAKKLWLVSEKWTNLK